MRRFSRAIWALALAFGLCSAVSPAAAQPKDIAPEAAPTDNPEYDRLLKEALNEFQLGNWTEARSLFERYGQGCARFKKSEHLTLDGRSGSVLTLDIFQRVRPLAVCQ